MSRVYFHSPDGEVELWGGERAWLGGLCNDVATGILDIRNNHEQIARYLSAERQAQQPQYPCPDYFARFQQWCQSVELSLRVAFDGEGTFSWKGRGIDTFSLILNTAARIGGDALKLAARIHGQCEIHCWTEGSDRAWLAGIIDQGLAAGLFRSPLPGDSAGRKIGWENVAEFLRSRDDEPVVLSYSVCDQFPNQYTAQWQPPEGADEDAWYELPDDERWRLAMAALRESSGGLQIKRDDWDTFHFGHGLSILDLLVPDHERRLGSALGITEDEPVPASTGSGTKRG